MCVDLIQKLKECTTMGQADPIMSQLRLTSAQKKLVETSIILNNSPDSQQRNHAFSFMEVVIKELELGSHQSSHQISPYPNPAHQSNNGENSMMHMQDTENSWNGVNTDKAMQFMIKYTKQFLNHYHQNHMAPLSNKMKNKINETNKQINKNFSKMKFAKQRIQELRHEIKEVKTNTRKEILELSSIQGIKEAIPVSWNEPSRKFDLDKTRNAITLMDRELSGGGNLEYANAKV